MFFRALIVIIACGALAACNGLDNKIGTTVKGDRIAVMERSKTLQPDKELQGMSLELPELLANHSWMQAGYDATHVLPNAQMDPNLKEIWRTDIGTGSSSDYKLLARPVVGNNHIYTMDAEGRISAFDIQTGDRVWQYNTTPEDRDDDAIGGGLGVDGSTVYATTGFGEALALQASDGKVLWRRMLMNPLRAAPTIDGSKIYVVSIDNELNALDGRTGEILWKHHGIAENATLMGASNPAVSGDSVVVTYSSGEIYNLRTDNGRASWNYGLTTPTQVGALPAIADIRGLPVIDRGRVFAISHSGRMAAIDQRSGERVWEADIGGINTPLIAGNAVFVLSNDRQLIALTRDSGRIVWVKPLQELADPEDHDSDPVFWSGPILGSGHLWLTNSLGQLVHFSPVDGKEEGMLDLENPTYLSPLIAQGIVFVVTDNGKLIALR